MPTTFSDVKPLVDNKIADIGRLHTRWKKEIIEGCDFYGEYKEAFKRLLDSGMKIVSCDHRNFSFFIETEDCYTTMIKVSGRRVLLQVFDANGKNCTPAR